LNLQGENSFASFAGTPPIPWSSMDSSLGSWLHESGVTLEDFFRKQSNGNMALLKKGIHRMISEKQSHL